MGEVGRLTEEREEEEDKDDCYADWFRLYTIGKRGRFGVR